MGADGGVPTHGHHLAHGHRKGLIHLGGLKHVGDLVIPDHVDASGNGSDESGDGMEQGGLP